MSAARDRRLHGEVRVCEGVVQHLRLPAQRKDQVAEACSIWGQAQWLGIPQTEMLLPQGLPASTVAGEEKDLRCSEVPE